MTSLNFALLKTHPIMFILNFTSPLSVINSQVQLRVTVCLYCFDIFTRFHSCVFARNRCTLTATLYNSVKVLGLKIHHFWHHLALSNLATETKTCFTTAMINYLLQVQLRWCNQGMRDRWLLESWHDIYFKRQLQVSVDCTQYLPMKHLIYGNLNFFNKKRNKS